MEDLERCAGDNRDVTEQLLAATQERANLERQMLDMAKEKSQLTDEFALQVAWFGIRLLLGLILRISWRNFAIPSIPCTMRDRNWP